MKYAAVISLALLGGCASSVYPSVDEIRAFRAYASSECRKLAAPKTAKHRACMRYLAEREAHRRVAAQRDAQAMALAIAGGMSAMSQSYSRMSSRPVYVPPRPVHCRRFGNNITCF